MSLSMAREGRIESGVLPAGFLRGGDWPCAAVRRRPAWLAPPHPPADTMPMFESATTNLTNQFLIAMPGMADPFFARTVTYLCQHSEEGALGIIINRPLRMTLKDIIEQMDIEFHNEALSDMPVYFGGPVHTERGFVLHEPVGEWKSTLRISDSLSLTTSLDILEAISRGEGPHKVLLALGYAGWGEGQLEREIVDNAWLNAEAEQSIIFNLPAAHRWKAAAGLMGVDMAQLSSQVGHG